jgi:hypothetical protein
MPRSCATCEHPEREAIDRALVGGASNRATASLYDLSEAAVRRHRTNHLAAKLVMAQAAEEVAQADGLLEQVRDLQGRALAILGKAEAAGDLRAALGAIRECRSNLELIGEVTRELDRAGTVNLELTVEWQEIKAVLVNTLSSYPDAKQAVFNALEEAPNGN